MPNFGPILGDGDSVDDVLALEIQEEGVQVLATVDTINVVGAGATVTNVGGVATITIPGGAPANLEVEDEGVDVLVDTSILNFVGAGVTASTPGAGRITVTIPGGGAGAGIASGTGGAATNDLGAWYIYRAATGAYYGANKLSGESVYTHATDVKSVWDSILGAMPGDETTANTARSGGSIEFGPGIFNTSGPLVATTIRSLQVFGQGWLQQTIIQQNGNLAANRFLFEIGTATDTTILQGFEYHHMQIRGGVGTAHTGGGGIAAWCGFSNFHDLVIESTHDTAFFLNGVTGSDPDSEAFSVVLDNIQISGFNAVSTNTAYGIDVGTLASDSDIMNCIVHQDSEGQDRGLAGIRVKGGTTRIKNTHVYFCHEQGILFDGNGLCSFIDVICESNGLQGLFISGPNEAKIIGGAYYSNGQDSASANIYMVSTDEFTISGLTMAKQRASTSNAPRNIQVESSNYGSISNCTMSDATDDHILLADCTHVDVHNIQFRDGITYSGGTNGATPDIAVRLYGATSNCKVHDNNLAGSTMGLEENSSTWGGNYNEFYHNKIGLAAGVVLQDGTTYTSRKWGNRNLTGVLFPDRIYGGKSATGITAANDITASHGRMFSVSGSTEIRALRSAGWDEGVEITLLFADAVTVKNNTAGSAGFASFLFAGLVDFPATANDILTVAYNGTVWLETGRTHI